MFEVVDVEPTKRSAESASGSSRRFPHWEGLEVYENLAFFDFPCNFRALQIREKEYSVVFELKHASPPNIALSDGWVCLSTHCKQRDFEGRYLQSPLLLDILQRNVTPHTRLSDSFRSDAI